MAHREGIREFLKDVKVHGLVYDWGCGTGKPMMADEEIGIIDSLIETLQPQSCLEWGSGNSTLHFSQHDCIKSWLSIEHNGHYIEYLRDKTSPNTSVIWADKEWYIDSVKLNGRKYDLILIDGNTREGCLNVAHDIIKLDGVILLHDSGRADYQSFIQLYKPQKLTDGEVAVKEGGFAHRGLTMFTL